MIVIQEKSKGLLATDEHGRVRIAPIQAAFLSYVFARENFGQKHANAVHPSWRE